MKKIILLLIGTILFIGCEEDEPIDGRYDSLGFITEYWSPDQMSFDTYGSEYIYVDIKGDRYGGNVHFPSDLYRELAKKYGDTKKQRVPRHINGTLTLEPDGVRVVCDADMPGYPAGTPLDDIILMYGWTYKEYIDSRYTHYTAELENDYGYGLGPTYTVGHSPFMKYLSEIKKGDLVLMCSDFFLLPQGDWPPGEYNLTITLFGEDFELSGSVPYVVE